MISLATFRTFRRSPRLWVRLACGFGALVTMMVVVVVLATLQFRDLARHGEQTLGIHLQRLLKVQAIDQHVQGHGSAMARLLTSPRDERERIYPVLDAEYAAIDTLIHELSQHPPDTNTARGLADVAARRNHYREAFIDIGTQIESGDVAGAGATFNGAGLAAMRALLASSKALLNHEQGLLAARQQEVQAQIQRSEWLLAALALVAVCLSVLLAWRTTASVARPLARVEAAAGRIAGGDYGARVDVRSGDELGRVAQAMNTMATAVALREAQIENVAYVDRLTGLPNRTLLRRLARESEGACAVLLMDVARLRIVNEVLGFEAGDALLLQLAQRLQCVLVVEAPPADAPVLACLPGGVFAVLCRRRSRSDMENLRERLDKAATAAMTCDGHAVDVHLVYGLADTACAPGLPVEALLQRAELAVGDAKRQRRDWAWHVPVDDAARARQLNLLSNLRRAAAAGELEMWLQPKQCLRSGATLGLEALVRWRHPERGYVAPVDFIPFAERTGHIGVVTTTMLDAALRLLATWATGPQALRRLSIAVNVSALDLRDAAFSGRVHDLARRHQAPLDRLRLEITESSLMEDADRVLPVLHALRALGVELSIDDFGTGYSSLAYLQRLPVNELKIDRSFVAEADLKPEARALLRTIVELGHSLKMGVTAEGIERAEELALLAELGCDVAQGYLISKPLSPEAARRFVQTLVQDTQAVAVV